MSRRAITDPTKARGEMLRAWEALSTAFEILEATGSTLAEPERGACLRLRTDVAQVTRRLGNMIAYLGGHP